MVDGRKAAPRELTPMEIDAILETVERIREHMKLSNQRLLCLYGRMLSLENRIASAERRHRLVGKGAKSLMDRRLGGVFLECQGFDICPL